MEDLDVSSETVTVDQLLSRCTRLQEAVISFRSQAAKQYSPVEVGTFLKSIAAERRSLERIAASNRDQTFSTTPEEYAGSQGSQLQHSLRSSNLSHLEAVWNLARRCRNVIALNRRENALKNGRRNGAVVDVVAEMGLLWVKIVTIKERKLLFEMAKEGWDAGWDDSEDEDDDEGIAIEVTDNTSSESAPLVEVVADNQSTLPLFKMVEGLLEASQCHKVQYRHPEVLVWFPNLREDTTATSAVVKVLAQLRATGATVHCGGGEVRLKSLPMLHLEQPIDASLLESMLPLTQPPLTSSIILDCTILLALISDLSHVSLDETDAYNEPLKKQLAAERSRPLLPKILYPALADRKLVTSTLAANRMREIVATLGTPDEQTRAGILMGDGLFSDRAISADLQDHFQNESIHDISESLCLPVQVIDTEAQLQNSNTPSQAALLDSILSDINKSIFLFGWHRNESIITSNRAVVKQIESLLYNAPGDVIGPQIYLVEMARSLVGKERASRR